MSLWPHILCHVLHKERPHVHYHDHWMLRSHVLHSLLCERPECLLNHSSSSSSCSQQHDNNMNKVTAASSDNPSCHNKCKHAKGQHHCKKIGGSQLSQSWIKLSHPFLPLLPLLGIIVLGSNSRGEPPDPILNFETVKQIHHHCPTAISKETHAWDAFPSNNLNSN